MDFDQGLVGLFCSVERVLELCGWDVGGVVVESVGVVPVDPAEGGGFDVFDALAGFCSDGAGDEFGDTADPPGGCRVTSGPS